MQTETADRLEQLTDSALQQLRDNLAAGRSDTLKAYLATMAKFHRYSFGNQMLIAFQRPEASYVAGFHGWKKLGRFVKKGEKGILIIAPCAKKVSESVKVDDKGDEQRQDVRHVFGFRGAYVWDVSQTDGLPLPEFARVCGDPSIYAERLDAMIAANGIKLLKVTGLGGALGVSTGGEIHILTGLDPASEFTVKIHEFAHELLHKGDRRSQTSRKVRETEAEAVSFVVSQVIGLKTGTASSDYIQLYNGDLETLTESLEFIRKTANTIIDGLKVMV